MINTEEVGLVLPGKAPARQLIRWVIAFNHWRWPRNFPIPQPNWWKSATFDAKYEFIKPIMLCIEEAVGTRAWLREGNKRRMSKEAFSEWYDLHHGCRVLSDRVERTIADETERERKMVDLVRKNRAGNGAE